MRFQSLLAGALFAAAASAKAVDSFAKGGTLPDNQILFGAPPQEPPSRIKRAASSTAASTVNPETDPNCTNSPTSRNCWGNGYSVDTDFDQKWPNTGVTRYYTLTISNTTCAPDGSNKRECFLINGQFPGPMVRANWGDTISVTVQNNMKRNGTGIHFHGIRQWQTPAQDGVGGITQCPIAPGQTQTYTFLATQFGTSWYHSHHSSQYGDGVLGPVVIDGPTSDNWDIDLGPMTVSDWYYGTAADVDVLTQGALTSGGAGPNAANVLINGTNKSPTGTGSYLKAKLTTGKKHLIRVINTSVDNAMRVSLDGHNVTIVTADFVPVQPISVESFMINIGQRYEIIVDANQTPGNYWLRAEPESLGCYSANDGTGLAIFTYSGVSSATPSSVSTYTNGARGPGQCIEPSPLTPWVSNTVGSSTQFIQQANDLDVSLLLPHVGTNQQNIVVWGINASGIDVNWNKPVLSYVMENNSSFPVTENLIELATEGEWVFWIIQQQADNGVVAPIPHPIHLHGHDFYVLGSATGTPQAITTFDITTDPQNLQYNNPTRRDTVTLPANGWVVIALPTDNPGAWLMHCHIAWHITEGFGVQFLEDSPAINLPGSSYTNQCASWNNYAATEEYAQFESGL